MQTSEAGKAVVELRSLLPSFSPTRRPNQRHARTRHTRHREKYAYTLSAYSVSPPDRQCYGVRFLVQANCSQGHGTSKSKKLCHNAWGPCRYLKRPRVPEHLEDDEASDLLVRLSP
jgi:hypothetical protein